MEDDDLIMIDIDLITITDEELDALILSETEYDPADFTDGTMDWELETAYKNIRSQIQNRENTARTTAFYETYLKDKYFIRSMYGVTGSILAEVRKADVLYFADLEEVRELLSYKLPEQIKIINYGEEILSEDKAEILAECFIERVTSVNEKRKPQEVVIEYFGTYSGYEVVGMTFWDNIGLDDISMMSLGAYHFLFKHWDEPNATGLLAFKDDEFIRIQDAYEAGFITDEDVAHLAENFPNAYFVKDDFYYRVLYNKTEDKIKADYLKRLQREDANTSELTPDDLEIRKYYGKYGECEVFLGYMKDGAEPDAMEDVKIGGYPFTFSSLGYYPDHFLVWENGNVFTLKEAAQAGKLSGDDIYRIARVHGAVPKTERMPYKDVDFEQDWFAVPAYRANLMGLMTGLDEITFGPYDVLPRAQFVSTLYRMSLNPKQNPSVSYEPVFADVKEDAWYAAAVTWAYQNGIVSGYENGLFGPADPVTREQMAIMLYRFAKYKQYDVSETGEMSDFEDAKDVSSYAKECVNWCAANEIIKGNNGKLLPQQNTSRAECAAMVTRFAERYVY